MATLKKGGMVTINDLEVIGKITRIIPAQYEVEYRGASYEIISQNFTEDALTSAPADSEIGQIGIKA